MIKLVKRAFHGCIFAGALLMTACGGEQGSASTDSSGGTSASSSGSLRTDSIGGSTNPETTEPPGKIDGISGMTTFTGCDTEGLISLVDLLDQPADGMGYVERGLLVSKLWDPRRGFAQGLVPGREYTVSVAVRPTNASSVMASLSVLTGNCIESPPGMLNRELVSLASMEAVVTGAHHHTLTHTFVYDGPTAAQQNLNAVLLVGMGPDTAFLVDDLTITDNETGQMDISNICYADPVELSLGLENTAEGTRYELYLPSAESGLIPGQHYTLSLPVTPTEGIAASVAVSVLGMTCDKSVIDMPFDPDASGMKKPTTFAEAQFELSGETRQTLQLDFLYSGPRIHSDIPSGLVVVNAPPGVELTLGEHQLIPVQKP